MNRPSRLRRAWSGLRFAALAVTASLHRAAPGPRMVPVVVLCASALAGCKRQYSVGDHVYVEWEGQDYPAVIIAATSPTKYKVHYDGYDNVWDEIVVRERIKGLAEGNIRHPEPPAKVRAKALQAAQSNTYKTGDRVRVEWHGQLYMATVMSIVGQERYRIRYDGYGPEWDETVGIARIQPRTP
ncbi:MAG: Tudor-knot domain-containing protein [Polyangiaceae bacterium]